METTDQTIVRGDSVNWTVTVKNEVTRAAYNITGARVFFTIKDLIADLDISSVFKKSWTSHFDPTHGKTYLTMTPAQTAVLLPKDYLYDIQIKTAGGDVYTVAKGTITVEGDVTLRTNTSSPSLSVSASPSPSA
jgi:hypothetical protein